MWQGNCFDHNGYEAVVSPADFRALSVEDAWSVNNKGCLVEPARNCIYFYAQGWYGSRMKYVFCGDEDSDWGFYGDYHSVICL